MRRTNGLEGQLSLFDENRNPRPEHTRRKVNISDTIKLPISSRDSEIKCWEKRARIILPRFPELGRGERIRTQEINKRINELKATDYYIPKYDKYNNAEAWNCYMQLRKEIQFQAVKYCPEVVRSILSQNARRREETKNPFLR